MNPAKLQSTKINIKKSIVLLYTNREWSEIEIKKAIHLQ
jgi:hypothetical protein